MHMGVGIECGAGATQQTSEPGPSLTRGTQLNIVITGAAFEV